MNVQRLTPKYPFYKSLNEKFAMWQVSEMSLKKQPVSYSELHSLIFVLKGSVDIVVGEKNIKLKSQCFIDLIGVESLTILHASLDALCYHLIFSESIIDELFKNNPPFPLSYIMENQNKPISITESHSGSIVLKRLELLDEIVSDGGHLYFEERLLHGLMLLFLDIANIYIFQEGAQSFPSSSDRKRELFVHFAKLTNLHAAENHTVAFYATKLCVTPQYLARIVKELTHMTVYQFLQKNMIGKSIKLLKDTNKTVLQISEELNFSDQSTFTKYFKRYTGYSPSEYRQNIK